MKSAQQIVILAACALPVFTPHAVAQQATQPAGLDAVDERRVMTELANHGLDNLLDYEFQVNKTPHNDRSAFLTLLSIHSLADPNTHLGAAERQELIQRIATEMRAALPTIKEPTTLLQTAKVLLTTGVEPQVNTLEYWGENANTQAQIRPLAEIVLEIYDQAAARAAKAADEIANHLDANDDAGAKRWQAADDLRNLATFSQNMARYDLCLAMDRNDPERAKAADVAIEGLKQFDTNDSAVQPLVRNRIGKLNMAKGDYDAAEKIFDTVINNPNGQIKPAPDAAQQYEARYFTIVCEILAHNLDHARQSMDALAAWQKSNLSAEQQLGASAAFSMLNYRILTEQADQAANVDDKAKDNSDAIATLMQLLKDQPQYKTVIFQQVSTRLPANPDLARLDPLLLLALQQQGEQEYLKPAGQKMDVGAVEHAIAAAMEIVKRQGQPGVDVSTASQSAYVIGYLLEKLGKSKEAASAFLDYAQNFQTDIKNANDALDHATALIAQLRRTDLQDADTRKLYDRFLPIAIASPFNRSQFAFEYAVLLQREQKYKQAIEYFNRVPADDKRILSAHFYEMVALKQRLNDDNDKMPGEERGRIMSQIQSLADEVNSKATVAESAAANDDEKKRYASMLVRTALLAGDLANHEQKNPKRSLELLTDFEDKVKGMPRQQELLFEALSLRVNAYMALGQTNEATSALVQLLKTKQGNEGPALVFDLLKKLDQDMDRARAAGDKRQVSQLAQNRAALSGFLVTWAANNSDPKIKILAPRYKIFDASTKQLAAELTDDPAQRRAGLETALKNYTELFDPNNPDPIVQLGMGLVEYDLGQYKAAKESLGPLVVNKRLGAATATISENGEPKTVENTQYWEGVLKLLRSTLETARRNPNDTGDQKDLESARVFLKQLYVQWPVTIGGKKFHGDFEKLRAELVPDFHPQDLQDAAASGSNDR